MPRRGWHAKAYWGVQQDVKHLKTPDVITEDVLANNADTNTN